MTETRKSTLMEEIKAIFSGTGSTGKFVWRAEFTVKGERYEVMRTQNIDILRNYSEDYAEEISLEVQIPPSHFLDQIYPNRQNITVTIYQIPLDEDGNEDWSQGRMAETYRGMVKNYKDQKLNPAGNIGSSEDLDVVHGPVTVSFQLANQALEQLRLLMPRGGNYRQTNPGKLLRSILDSARQQIKVNNSLAIEGVDMVTPDNQNDRALIMIPHGTRLTDIPRLLQDQQGGIYNADIAWFLQGNLLYVWPKLGINRSEKSKPVLTIFDVPANQFPGVERTFRVTDGQVIIISTGQSTNSDNSEALDLNQGNGIRFTDASQMLSGMIGMEGTTPVARRGVSSSEFMDGARDTGFNFAPMSADRISSNPHKQASKLAARKGMIMEYTWENANPFLLYPGQKVKVYTPRDDVLEERQGVLISSQYFISPKGKTLRDGQQVCVAHLAVFVSRDTEEDKLPDIPS